jgi:DNA polymerase-3 subunit epsilon
MNTLVRGADVVSGQRSFDELGTPLHDVTFCVVDLETTGGSAADCGITEMGAVKVRGGQCLGTYQTLVNPGCTIPPFITVLTGITESMLLPAPRIESVLPSFVEFLGGSVLVGHNVRFDVSFLNAALSRDRRPRLGNTIIDTCALARRLLREEVPDCRLGTLASQLRLPHQPSHRALDDALATVDLLHMLLERAAAFGVLGLDDLVALPTMGGHPQAAKLRLTTGLPRAPGVYTFRDRAGRALYVGKATNLRARVRSYFSSDDRRKIGALLREAQQVDHIVCASTLEAAVVEARLIAKLLPRFNRRGTRWKQYVYLKLTTNEPFPRLSVVRVPRDDGAVYLGPFSSSRSARLAADAIESVVPLRRCTTAVRPGRSLRAGPCAPAQLGVALCPCAGGVSVAAYAEVVDVAVRGLTVEPALLLEPLRDRMDALAAVERYEEAADARDRAAALANALLKQRRLEGLRGAGRIELDLGAGVRVELDGGRLTHTGPQPTLFTDDAADASDGAEGAWIPKILVDELACVASWLEANAGRFTLVHCDSGLASRVAHLPSFAAGSGVAARG